MATFTIEIDGLVFAGERKGNLFYNPPLKGWGLPPIRNSEYNNSGADGGQITEQFYAKREIPISATLMETSFAAMEAKKTEIRQVLGIRKVVEVTLTTPTGRKFKTFAKVYAVDAQQEHIHVCNYDIELVADSPIIYDFTAGDYLSVIVDRDAVGGVFFDTIGAEFDTLGLPFVDGGGGTDANNTGEVEANPIIVVTGTAQNPAITNATTGQTISVGVTVGASDVLIIDVWRRLATLNGESVFNFLQQDDWWQMQLGHNDLHFTSTGGSDDGVAEVRWNNGYYGVL